MYPVWFLSYRNKDRVAYATVNGQTGKVVADMPIDSKKYVLSSLILAVILFALLNLFFTIRPVTLLGFACMLVIVSAITYAVELDAIWRKESNADDAGVLAAMEKESFEYKVDRWMEKGETPQETAARKRRVSKAFSVKRKKELRPGDWLKKHGIPLFIILISFGPVILLFASYLIWPIIMLSTVISGIKGMNNGKKLDDLRKSP